MSRALQVLTVFAALLGSTLTPSRANAQGASVAVGLPVDLREVTQTYAADGVIEAVHEFCVEHDWELRYLTVQRLERPSFAISRLPRG